MQNTEYARSVRCANRISLQMNQLPVTSYQFFVTAHC